MVQLVHDLKERGDDLSARAAKEIERLLAMTKDLPDDMGDIYDLPEALLSELSAWKETELDDQIVAVISSYGGEASLDQILVGLYRKFGVIQKRRFVQNKLYRMNRTTPVDGKKGVYKLPPLPDALRPFVASA